MPTPGFVPRLPDSTASDPGKQVPQMRPNTAATFKCTGDVGGQLMSQRAHHQFESEDDLCAMLSPEPGTRHMHSKGVPTPRFLIQVSHDADHTELQCAEDQCVKSRCAAKRAEFSTVSSDPRGTCSVSSSGTSPVFLPECTVAPHTASPVHFHRFPRDGVQQQGRHFTPEVQFFSLLVRPQL